MRRSYHTIEKKGKANARKLAKFFSKHGLFLLPMVDLIEECRLACDELIDGAGSAERSPTSGTAGCPGSPTAES